MRFFSSSLCIWLVIESMTSDRIIWWKRIHVTDPDQFVEIFSRPQAFGTEARLFLYMWLRALVSGYCVSAVVLFCCFVWIWAFRMRIMWSLLCDFDPFGIKLSFFHEKKRFHFVTTFAGIYYFICPFSHWVDGYRNGCWFLVVLRFWNFCEKKLEV